MRIKFDPGFWDSFHRCFGLWGRFKHWVYDHNPYRNFRTMIQRGTRGYCATEHWGTYVWLGKVIVNNLEHFRESKKCGYPGTFKDFYEWQRTLDRMLEVWRTLNDWDDVSQEIFNRHQATSKGKKKKGVFGSSYKQLTNKEREEMTKELPDTSTPSVANRSPARTRS